MRKQNPAALLLLALAIALSPLTPTLAQDKTFSQQELDQIMAPVALYPDALLSQILMAATYPDQVAEAASWSKKNTETKGDDAVKAVQDKPWDPSVASLVAFPQALAMMGDKPDWVAQMGDAFLADPDKVMDTVQGLRKKAKEEGNLESSEQQKVIVEGASSQTIIKIEPSDPQVIYVPTYNPTIVYGTWWWPAYPPFYWPPPPGYGFTAGLVSGIGFGIGIAITNSIWGGFDWYRHDVNINVNRYNNININKKLDVNSKSVSWKHNSVNRKGRDYADAKSRQKYGQKLDGADKREEFRGRDAERDKARAALEKKGIDPAAERGKLSGSGGQQVRDKVKDVNRDAISRPQRKETGAASRIADSGDRGTQLPGRKDSALSGLGDRNGGRAVEQRGGMSGRSLGGGGRAGGGLGGGGHADGGFGGGGGRVGGGGLGGRR
jgi:hypothetical protein